MATERMEKKSSKQGFFDDIKAEKGESPLDFLARTGVTTEIKQVVMLLIENRPKDPISFLADYYDNIADTTTALMRAHQKLLLVHHSRPIFYNNVYAAFDILSKQKGSNGLKGLTGKVYNDLLTMLCRDLKSYESEPILKRITCLDHEVVKIEVFRCGIIAVIVFQDFLKQAEVLYHELDLSGRGHADKQLCEVALENLKEAVTMTTDDPVSVLQAGALLSSYRLNTAMYKVLVKNGSASQVMGLDEFMVSAAEIFMNQIPDLK